jgi:hypothetical protein
LVAFIRFNGQFNVYHSPNPPAIAGAKIVTAPANAGAFEDIIDSADLVASYARSIAEAAFRRDTIQLRIYRAQFRQHAADLMALIRDVAPIQGGCA